MNIKMKCSCGAEISLAWSEWDLKDEDRSDRELKDWKERHKDCNPNDEWWNRVCKRCGHISEEGEFHHCFQGSVPTHHHPDCTGNCEELNLCEKYPIPGAPFDE